MLNQPFGKENRSQCFSAQAALRHVLLPLWNSGFVARDSNDWNNFAVIFPDVTTLRDLLDEYGDTEFNSIQGYPANLVQETATAALLTFEGDATALVRWVGGPHVAAHRDTDTILAYLKGKIDDVTLGHLDRLYRKGAPNYCNASATEDNFHEYLAYGNHKSMEEDPEQTLRAMAKDNKKSYTLVFDSRIIPFVLNAHVTPQGLVDLQH